MIRNRLAAVITKDPVMAKDFRTYATIFLRQEKTLRDHGAGRQARREQSGPASHRQAGVASGVAPGKN
jgi:hypothetical protein